MTTHILKNRPKNIVERLYQGYIFDMDGTLYLGETLLPGVHQLIGTLRELGKRLAFISNNPTRDIHMYVDKLTGLGLTVRPDEIITTVDTTVQWILHNRPQAVVYPISEEPLIRALRNAGIRISENPEEVDIVIASYDRNLTWKKLQIGFEAIWYYKRAILMSTNPDHYCPFPGGRGEVDAGAVIAALENSTQHKLDVNCGKPSPVMLEAVIQLMNLDISECIVTGDRLYTDIRMGIDAGMDTCLVFTGETTPEMLAEWPEEGKPTYALERIDRLLPPNFWRQ